MSTDSQYLFNKHDIFNKKKLHLILYYDFLCKFYKFCNNVVHASFTSYFPLVTYTLLHIIKSEIEVKSYFINKLETLAISVVH